MRILMVTRETGPDRRYGLGRSLLPVVEALRARGIDTRYFCQDDLEPPQLKWRDDWWTRMTGWPVLRSRHLLQALVRAWMERLQVGVAAARLARAASYSHVHAHDPWIALGVWFGLFGSKSRVRWGVTEHGYGSYSVATHQDGLLQGPMTQRLMRRVENTVLGRADWVIAPTQSCLTELARDLCVGAVPAHWRAVPHARPTIPAATPESRTASRQALRFAPDDFVVVAVGRLVPLKCFDRLIAACAKQSMPNLRLAILGGGDGAALRACAASHGIEDKVHFEFVDDVTPFLHGADIYVSASSTEAFGLANFEAMAAGLPAICSPVGGVAEVVGDGAWLVPNEVDSLAAAIATLAGNEAFRHDWARRALARVATWPAVDEVTQRYVDIYQAAGR